ncbi:MAG: hypothetical protein E6Q76_12585 [Rhizobium sp.]|nr:MAG: hypothetical protein E6Q76_12585 [Rhizobium sp.]
MKLFRSIQTALLVLALIGASACSRSNSTSTSHGASDPGNTGSNGSTSLPLGIGCGWTVVSDADVTNVLYPDQAAMYWLAVIPNIPGARLRVDGVYPNARYFSFNVYDPILRPVDAIADYQINPNVAGRNPFATEGVAYGSGYRAYVDFSVKPDTVAPNTIYSGSINTGNSTIQNPLLTVLAYRIYVPADGLRGNVQLPQLTIEAADGSRDIGTLPNCDAPLLPNVGGTLPSLGLNPLLASTTYPEVLSALPYPVATYPTTTRVFYGLPDSYIGILNNVSPVPIPVDTSGLPLTGGGGFLSNKDNAYTTTAFGRDHGSLFVFRARAPTFRTEKGVSFGKEQTRYWSICQNEFVTQRYVACVRDEQIPLDDQGYYTIAISDEALRPSNATAEHDVAFLPWGAYPDGLLIYRQLLASKNFAAAIRNVPQGTDPASVMGDYFPQSTYCDRAVFESAGPKAADIFAACLSAASP